MINFILVLLSVFFIFNATVQGHQPRVSETQLTSITDPEVSKAYYAKLSGSPDVYQINATQPVELYVNILVPDITGQQKDIFATILKDGTTLAELDGAKFEWEQFFEPFGHDSYWKGPEYKSRVEAGNYEIRVSSTNNDSKYSLAVGEIEKFNFAEIKNSLNTIPRNKKEFFNKSPIDFILSPFGFGLIITMYGIAFIFGFAYRLILNKLFKSKTRKAHHNIGRNDRYIRLAIALGLLLWAITTTWSPLLLFFSGFALFEAIFSWCGFYAALGKNTCPIE